MFVRSALSNFDGNYLVKFKLNFGLKALSGIIAIQIYRTGNHHHNRPRTAEQRAVFGNCFVTNPWYWHCAAHVSEAGAKGHGEIDHPDERGCIVVRECFGLKAHSRNKSARVFPQKSTVSCKEGWSFQSLTGQIPQLLSLIDSISTKQNMDFATHPLQDSSNAFWIVHYNITRLKIQNKKYKYCHGRNKHNGW